MHVKAALTHLIYTIPSILQAINGSANTEYNLSFDCIWYDYSKQAKKQVISYQSADVWILSIVVGIIIHYALDVAVGTTFCRKVLIIVRYTLENRESALSFQGGKHRETIVCDYS